MADGQNTPGFIPDTTQSAAPTQSATPGFIPDTSADTSTPPASQGAVMDTLGKIGEQGAHVATGMAKGVGDTVSGISHILNKIPGVGETLAPSQGMAAADIRDQAHGTGEEVGKGLEGLAEFAAGDEALEGVLKGAKVMRMAKMSPEVAQALDMADKSKTLHKIMTTAGKGALVGGTQGVVKGAAEDHPIKEGLTEAAGGAAGGALGEGVSQIANSELAKAMMNRASGVTKGMIRYGQDPAKALVEEKLPTFSTLSNRGRQAAANAKLNELKPSLDHQLQASPQVMNWRNELGNVFTDTKAKIHDLETLSDEQKAADITRVNAMEENLAKKWPTGDMSVFDMNELKSRVQKYGSDFDSKPDSSDIMRGFYQDIQGTLKDAVNHTVPEAADLNRRIANLVALRDASHETVLAERAGLGPMSGFGVTRKLEAAAGHVAPTVAKASQPAAKVIKMAGAEAPRIHFQDSQNGDVHSVPADQIHEALKIDPKLTIVNGPEEK